MIAPIDVHTSWRKSSYSGGDSNCVEIAFGTWRKSSYSGPDANCVEVAHTADAVGIRDSKNPAGPRLALPSTAHRALLATVR